MPADHADVVVIGSGFGGAVSAYRLAEAGLSVVLLERGQPYPPGSFARTPAEMRGNFWDPTGNKYGLFDVWTFRGFDSVVSSGLGGGSLIYANVLMRKDESSFVHEQPMPGGGYEHWPVTRADLDPHYDAVEQMMKPALYPLEHPVFSDMPRTKALREAATALKLDWKLAPLAVSFAARPDGEPGIGLPIEEAPYGNLHGQPRRTCRLCAECNLGCNEGAKNSLDHTYLSAARHHGADLRTLCEVQALRPASGGGYQVGYLQHGLDGSMRARTISCDRLVLAAGTYGTGYLLQHNRARFPGLSKALGTRFSGNGDLLTFLLKARDRETLRELDATRGPVITSAVRIPDRTEDGVLTGRGHYVEDAGYPAFVAWLVESADVPGQLFRMAEFAARRVFAAVTRSPRSALSREIASLLDDGTLTASSVPLLGMGRDVPDGVMGLRDRWLDVQWTTETSRAYFNGVRSTMRRISEVLGGEYVDNPVWLRKRIITVHPLGGAPIGRHSDEGVCDPYGEVFGHPGMYVADGAAMPGPIGTNPSLTIAAMANRMCDRLLESRTPTGATMATPTSRRRSRGATPAARGAPAGPGGTAGAPSPSTLYFTEEMSGYFALGQHDPVEGAALGKRQQRELAFRLTITADDVERFLEQPAHLARVEGWLDYKDLGGRLVVHDGRFNLLVPGSAQGARRMLYRLYFDDIDGNPYTLAGYKDLQDDPGLDLWPDSTTLFAQLFPGTVPEVDGGGAPCLGAGVLRIRKRDFLRQLTTMRVIGPTPLRTLEQFGEAFLGQLWDVYGPQTTN